MANAAVVSLPTKTGADAPWAAIVRASGFDEAMTAAEVGEPLPRLPPLRVVWIDELPRKANGKVDRRLLR